jgi:hypothetical protein
LEKKGGKKGKSKSKFEIELVNRSTI